MAQDLTPPSNGRAVPPACPTRKKFFLTKEAALEFAERLHTEYNTQQQYVYKCEDCNGYHLTFQSPESYAMQQSRQSLPRPVGGESGIRRQRGTADEIADRRRKVRDMVAAGESIRSISEKLGVKEAIILTDIKSGGGLKVLRQLPPSQTLESLDQRERSLKAELDKLTADRIALLEAKAFKLLPCLAGKGVLIKKESDSLGLSLDDAYELVDKLTEYLSDLGNGDSGSPTQ